MLSLFPSQWLLNQCDHKSHGDLGAGQEARWLNIEFLVSRGDFSHQCKFIPEQRTVTFLSIRKRYILKVVFFFQCWLAKKAKGSWQGNKAWFPHYEAKDLQLPKKKKKKICGKGNCCLLSPFRVRNKHLSFLLLHSH